MNTKPNSGSFVKGIKKANQGVRGPDKVLPAARAAIADFVDGNAHRLVEWLDQVANGVPKLDNKGEPLPGEYQLRPDPAKAFDMFQSVIEYHIPKLARTESTVDLKGKLTIEAIERRIITPRTV